MSILSCFPGGKKAKLQEKTVKSTTAQQTIYPSNGYDGINKITVNPIILQTKTVTPSRGVQNITPGNGYDGLNKVTISSVPLLEEVAKSGVWYGYVHSTHKLIIKSNNVPQPDFNDLLPDTFYLILFPSYGIPAMTTTWGGSSVSIDGLVYFLGYAIKSGNVWNVYRGNTGSFDTVSRQGQMEIGYNPDVGTLKISDVGEYPDIESNDKVLVFDLKSTCTAHFYYDKSVEFVARRCYTPYFMKYN